MNMPELDLKDTENKKLGTVEASSGVFEAKVREGLVQRYVTMQLATRRGGNAATKQNKGELHGSNAKPWRQKGTGRARAGTIRSPIWRSGGVTFAHVFKPSKKKKVNKKMYRAALRSILSRLINEERLVVIDNLEINEPPKTSEIRKIVAGLGLSNAVFVFKEKNQNFEIASNNLFNISSQSVNSLNPIDLINAEKVVFTVDAINAVSEVLA